ncbi:Ribonuclease H1 [Dissostichus eleginoides]|uniref:Ribonuclease H1 n=1 Tax=Dissostichus eleginoides TaxID=100907 RepID=A0AAD9BSE5_DISEL|nr:Ribonuclease H1 [Dissostichus eleginoides]
MFRLTGVFRALRRTVCSCADDMPKGKFYFAVRKGFKPGVYSTWDECKGQVNKFPAASFKKFASEKDAWAFFRGVDPSPVPQVKKVSQSLDSALSLLPKRGPEPLEYIALGKKRSHSVEAAQTNPKRVKPSESASAESASAESSDGFTYMGDAVVVYTDGGCTGNGRKGAKAGIGVYWGPNHPLNVADPLEGRQTNQRAEIQTWKVNGWRLKSGGPITNKDDFMKLDRLNAEVEVVWLHIPGHSGFRGNEEADRLSREGALKPLPKKQ